MPYLSRNNFGGTSIYSDPFTESAAYFDWANPSDGFGQRNFWPDGRSGKQPSDIPMPDFVPSSASESMHLSGPSLEDDPMSLKVPNNTPAGFPLTTHGFPHDLATSLTNSLLNQPLPLPVHLQSIPPPAAEIKSRKENRHLAIPNPTASSSHSPQAVDMETRKFSQPIFGMLGNMAADASFAASSASTSETRQSPSPSPSGIFSGDISRNASAVDFGTSVANLNAANKASCSPLPLPDQHPLDSFTNRSSSVPLCAVGGTGGLGGGLGSVAMKRSRHFTPASAKVIDEEDEPRRAVAHE